MAERAERVDTARRGGKSAAAFRTISEVAAELDVPPHVLRFWEAKFPQVHPLKRGGGRRYYRPEDIDLLRGIRDLLYTEGYTIKGVQKLLRETGIRPAAPAGEERAPMPPGVAAFPKAGRGALDEPRKAALRGLIGDLERLRDRLRQGI